MSATVYYATTYGELKKHLHQLHGGEVVGHSDDDPLTDDSHVILKVSHADHVHLYLEQNGFSSLHPSHEHVQNAATKHPIMRPR